MPRLAVDMTLALQKACDAGLAYLQLGGLHGAGVSIVCRVATDA